MANPTQVDVDVIAIEDSSAPHGVRFELSSGIGTPNKLTFKNQGGSPGFLVNFNLSDPSNTGCKFVHQKEDAMWVRIIDPQTPDPCPRCAMHWDQFKAQSVNTNDTQLVVRNLNEYVQDFAFSLRFTKPGVADPILYDPIGSNQNGQELSFFSTQTVSGFVVGAVVGGLLAATLG